MSDNQIIDSLGARAPNDILTIAEVAVKLRCSKAHVCHLLAGKVAGLPRLPHIPIGRRKVVLGSSLEAWMQRAEQGRP